MKKMFYTRVMLTKPFDNLPAVNTLIRLYKEGYSTPQLARYFDTHKGLCLKILRLHTIPIRSSYAAQVKKDDVEFSKKRFTDMKEVVEIRKVVLPIFEKGKYDALFDESVNKGHDYGALVKKYNVHIPAQRFGKIQRKSPITEALVGVDEAC